MTVSVRPWPEIAADLRRSTIIGPGPDAERWLLREAAVAGDALAAEVAKLTAEGDDVLSLGELAAMMSQHLDAKIADHGMSARELGWERIGKIAEEYGEVTEAWIGVAGSNPRKGKTHTEEDVLTELLDVALCALGAYEHMTGNAGICDDSLYRHAASRCDRMGLP